MRNPILGAALLIYFYGFAAWTMPKPVDDKPKAEWNLSACGSSVYTVVHAVLDTDGKHLTITYFMDGPGSVKKDDEPMVFAYHEGESKEGVTKFTLLTIVDDGKVIEVEGMIKGRRVVGFLNQDGKLSRFLYGTDGVVDGMVGSSEEGFAMCQAFRELGRDDQNALLRAYLDK